MADRPADESPERCRRSFRRKVAVPAMGGGAAGCGPRQPHQPHEAESGRSAGLLLSERRDPVFFVGTFQFLQTPGQVVMLSTFAHTFRIIRLDGGPPVGERIKLWQGDSRGRWEGNTLVVTTTNHNDKTWFDKVGSFHSDQLRVVERFTRVSPTTIGYRATVDDAKVFTRPWTIAFNLTKDADEEMIEEACFEGDMFGKESFAALPN